MAVAFLMTGSALMEKDVMTMPDRENATKTVINDLNVAKLMLCNPPMLTPEMCVRIGQAITSALALLKEKESEWLEDSDPGQEYGTTWACRKCGHSIHEPFIWNPYDSGYKYCLHCGAKMKVRLDD